MANVVLFADGAVGADCVNWLLDHHRDDIGLIGVTGANDIQRLAAAADVPTEVFISDEQMANAIRDRGIQPDFGMLLWWPKILREPLISIPRQGFVNTHPSLLPYNRGKHYSFWAIVEGSPFGVTLHFVDEGIDTGDIVAQRSIEVTWTDTGESLVNKAHEEMVQLVKDTYPLLRSGDISRRPQNLDAGSFHKSTEIDAATEIKLDRHYTARELLNLLRAKTYGGLSGCWFEDAGRNFEIEIKIKERT